MQISQPAVTVWDHDLALDLAPLKILKPCTLLCFIRANDTVCRYCWI